MPAPSPEPLTFAKADRLSLKPFCEKLEQYLLVDADYAEGSLVTALNAGFGCGKTTFLEMWKNDLLSCGRLRKIEELLAAQWRGGGIVIDGS
jgi:hypothetical protein